MAIRKILEWGMKIRMFDHVHRQLDLCRYENELLKGKVKFLVEKDERK